MSQSGGKGSKYLAKVGLNSAIQPFLLQFLERHIWAFTFGGLSLVLIAFVINEWTVNRDNWILSYPLDAHTH